MSSLLMSEPELHTRPCLPLAAASSPPCCPPSCLILSLSSVSNICHHFPSAILSLLNTVLTLLKLIQLSPPLWGTMPPCLFLRAGSGSKLTARVGSGLGTTFLSPTPTLVAIPCSGSSKSSSCLVSHRLLVLPSTPARFPSTPKRRCSHSPGLLHILPKCSPCPPSTPSLTPFVPASPPDRPRVPSTSCMATPRWLKE